MQKYIHHLRDMEELHYDESHIAFIETTLGKNAIEIVIENYKNTDKWYNIDGLINWIKTKYDPDVRLLEIESIHF